MYHKLILGYSPAQLEAMERGLQDGSEHPNEIKLRLAQDIVSIFCSPPEAAAARQRWDEVFRSGGVPQDIAEVALQDEERVLDLLRRLAMVSSGGEARRLMKQRGIRLNDVAVTDVQAMVPSVFTANGVAGRQASLVRLVAADPMSASD